jgi:hypothetical protein
VREVTARGLAQAHGGSGRAAATWGGSGGGLTTAQSGSTAATRGRQHGGRRMATPLTVNSGGLQAMRRMVDGGGDIFLASSNIGSSWFTNPGGFHG